MFSLRSKVDRATWNDMKLLAVTVILFRANSVLCQFPFANQNLAGNLPIPKPKPTSGQDWVNKLFVVRTIL